MKGVIKMTFKELRQASGMNLKQFGEYFDIPYRTVQDWEYGKRKCHEYLLKLMQYKLDKENTKFQEKEEELYTMYSETQAKDMK